MGYMRLVEIIRLEPRIDRIRSDLWFGAVMGGVFSFFFLKRMNATIIEYIWSYGWAFAGLTYIWQLEADELVALCFDMIFVTAPILFLTRGVQQPQPIDKPPQPIAEEEEEPGAPAQPPEQAPPPDYSH
jgi:hypothetical protein